MAQLLRSITHRARRCSQTPGRVNTASFQFTSEKLVFPLCVPFLASPDAEAKERLFPTFKISNTPTHADDKSARDKGRVMHGLVQKWHDGCGVSQPVSQSGWWMTQRQQQRDQNWEKPDARTTSSSWPDGKSHRLVFACSADLWPAHTSAHREHAEAAQTPAYLCTLWSVHNLCYTVHFCGFHDEPANKGQPSLTDPLIGLDLGCNCSVRESEREREIVKTAFYDFLCTILQNPLAVLQSHQIWCNSSNSQSPRSPVVQPCTTYDDFQEYISH